MKAESDDEHSVLSLVMANATRWHSDHHAIERDLLLRDCIDIWVRRYVSDQKDEAKVHQLSGDDWEHLIALDSVDIKEENAAIKKENAGLRQEITGVKKEIVDFRKHIDLLTRSNAHLTKENVGFRKEINRLTCDNSQLNETVTDLRTDLDGSKNEIIDLHVEIGGLLADVERLTPSNKRLERKANLAEACDTQLVCANSKLSERITILANDISQYKAILATPDGANARLLERLTNLE